MRPVAFYNQLYGPVQERFVLFNRQRFAIKHGVISGGACQLNNGEKHNVYILILVFIMGNQAEETFVYVVVTVFLRQWRRKQRR